MDLNATICLLSMVNFLKKQVSENFIYFSLEYVLL